MMFKTLAALVFALSCSASDVAAQTHPCDAPAVTTIQTNGPIAIGFCVKPVDTDGVAIPVASITSLRVKVDEVNVFQGALAPIGTPSATGSLYYETPKTLALAKGQHTVVAYVTTSNGVESEGSDPFVFTLTGVGMAKPVIKGPKK